MQEATIFQMVMLLLVSIIKRIKRIGADTAITTSFRVPGESILYNPIPQALMFRARYVME